jgi:hypothetical protein
VVADQGGDPDHTSRSESIVANQTNPFKMLLPASAAPTVLHTGFGKVPLTIRNKAAH